MDTLPDELIEHILTFCTWYDAVKVAEVFTDFIPYAYKRAVNDGGRTIYRIASVGCLNVFKHAMQFDVIDETLFWVTVSIYSPDAISVLTYLHDNGHSPAKYRKRAMISALELGHTPTLNFLMSRGYGFDPHEMYACSIGWNTRTDLKWIEELMKN
jgi:hypothetical protein